ncbi:nimrod B3 [Cochliomyia hominivorax]
MFKIIIILFAISSSVEAQFWKMNRMSERDMFILDVKSTMPAGICYKKVEAKASDPELRIRTVSFCCPGYQRNPLFPHSVKCDPICNEDCSNGICSEPDVCECFPGYERKGGRCESIYQ